MIPPNSYPRTTAGRAVTLLLLLTLAAGPLAGTPGLARQQDHPANPWEQLADKVSPELRERQRSARHSGEKVSVILQLNEKPTGRLNALLSRNGVHVKGNFESFDSMAVELPADVVDELAAFEEVSFVDNDGDTQVLGHVTTTTGAEQVRVQTGTAAKLDGTGVGVAVLDSGMYLEHKAFVDYSKRSRVVFSKDFTGENRVDDPFGHGTHVASAGFGNGDAWGGKYTGIAPNVKITNLRVLNSAGTGKVSYVLAALDWVYANRANTTYNIRVVNLSLGTPALTTYKNDPLCLAVRRLVNAGVVVVAAAGNDGKDQYGRKAYGRIHAPGNEPSAITVGAANGFGTDSRLDDKVTTYSSRGPTRSYWTDAGGTKHYDNLLKPDLVAPGNKLIFAESTYVADPVTKTVKRSYIVAKYAELDASIYATDSLRQMYMNGSSMAAPVVAGAAAMLLQANPKLTPNMVKMLLTYTAQPLKGFNAFEQGAGLLNVEGAVRVAKLVRTDLTSATALGAPLLTTATAPSPTSTVGGTAFAWSQGIVVNHTTARGSDLITKYQKPYALGALLGDGFTEGFDFVQRNTSMMSSGVMVSDGVMISDGTLLGNGTLFMSDDLLLGDGVMISDGVMVSDGVMISDGVMVSDGVMISDATTQSMTALVYGDNTACMQK